MSKDEALRDARDQAFEDSKPLIAALSRPSGADAELAKLVEFFRGEGYGRFGWNGDVMGWSPADTAINAMRAAPPLPEPVAIAPDLVAAGRPERLWLSAPNDDNDHEIWFDPDEGGTEYVRADALATLSAKLDAMRRERDNLSNELDAMEEEQCGCDDVIRKAEEAREAAEAEVARLKDENKELVAGLEAVDAEIVLTGQLKDIVDKALARALLPAKKEG